MRPLGDNELIGVACLNEGAKAMEKGIMGRPCWLREVNFHCFSIGVVCGTHAQGLERALRKGHQQK